MGPRVGVSGGLRDGRLEERVLEGEGDWKLSLSRLRALRKKAENGDLWDRW